MGRKNIRVGLTIGSVDKSITLGTAIRTRHITLGVNSPLNNQVDMTEYGNILNEVIAQRTPAKQKTGEKEAFNEQAINLIGIGAGQNLQTKDTVYWYIGKVHSFYQSKFKGEEEQASLWGFNITITQTGGRRNANFNIPYNSPEGLLELASDIINKHTTDGVNSILIPAIINMTDFQAKFNQAQTLREDAGDLDAEKQAGNELARNLCGYGEGQTSDTPGTLYFFFTKIRDLLLTVNEGNESQLELWGMKVVVSETSASDGEQAPQ